MAWEDRNGKRHYYRSKRVGKKVTRVYFGSGDAARLAAALDQAKRREKRPQDAPVAAIRQRWDEACRPLDQLIAATYLLMRAFMWTGGYVPNQPKGGYAVTTPSDPMIDELKDLVTRADAGDTVVLPQLRSFLDAHPEVITHCGEVATVAREIWLSLCTNNNPLLVEATRRKMVAWKASIAGPAPSPLEELMVEQIMACWLQAHYAEVMYAQAIEIKASEPIVREKGRQQEMAQARLAESLQQLAELQRFLPESTSDTVRLHCPSPA